MDAHENLTVEVNVDGEQTHDHKVFPLAIKWEGAPRLDEATSWVNDNRHRLQSRTEDHGAVLFRGFPLADPEDLDQFIGAFGWENFPYNESLSNAVRTNFTDRVFSANEAPADVAIYLHHEMAQTPVFPGRLFFFCQQAADQGGATPLCRSDVLFTAIQQECPQFARDCREKGLQYSNVMPGHDDTASGMGRSWQSTFTVEDRQQAEARMDALGYSWEWQDDNCLRATTPVLPAVVELPSGREVFFNQLIAAFRGWKDSRNDPAKAITFGDGTPMDRNVVLRVAELAEELTFDLPWQTGDVALVDNLLVMHGRRPFQGRRRVLASLVAAQQHVPA